MKKICELLLPSFVTALLILGDAGFIEHGTAGASVAAARGHFLSSLHWYCWVWSFPVSVRILAIMQSRRSSVAGCTYHARLQAL